MQTELAEAPIPNEPVAAPASEVRPVTMPLIDRIASGVITGAPPLLVLIGMYFGWTAHMLVWQDLLVLAIMYCGIGAGVTVGFHRLLTHRSFKCSAPMRAFWAILGSMAAEGPVIDWVATHRKHHQYSDIEGDPHSPHNHERNGFRGELRGLAHAHLGWVLNDPWVKFVDRTFVVWVIAGLAVAFGLGVALTGTVDGGLTALLWGGAARIFFVHHATFSINSLCHYFGKQEYDTGDHSRNLAWLAIPTWGEAWHNNHHAFPTNFRHGMKRWQLDPSAMMIRGMEMCGLAWDVVRVDPSKRKTISRVQTAK
jgi:stearoyl-CoA desaturase (delta-9 desaturase)